MKKNTGFTLVELLVVIGILGLLMVAILPQLGKGMTTANVNMCKMHLRDLHQGVVNIHSTGGRYPRGEGLEFLYNVWRDGFDHNEKGRDTMFCPEVEVDDVHEELKSIDADKIWRTFDEFTSDMTHYAALTSKAKRRISSGTTVLFADDNEGGVSNHRDGSLNVIHGDGSVTTYERRYFVEKGIYSEETQTEDDEEQVVLVGPDSQLPKLRKLKYN